MASHLKDDLRLHIIKSLLPSQLVAEFGSFAALPGWHSCRRVVAGHPHIDAIGHASRPLAMLGSVPLWWAWRARLQSCDVTMVSQLRADGHVQRASDTARGVGSQVVGQLDCVLQRVLTLGCSVSWLFWRRARPARSGRSAHRSRTALWVALGCMIRIRRTRTQRLEKGVRRNVIGQQLVNNMWHARRGSQRISKLEAWYPVGPPFLHIEGCVGHGPSADKVRIFL